MVLGLGSTSPAMVSLTLPGLELDMTVTYFLKAPGLPAGLYVAATNPFSPGGIGCFVQSEAVHPQEAVT